MSDDLKAAAERMAVAFNNGDPYGKDCEYDEYWMPVQMMNDLRLLAKSMLARLAADDRQAKEDAEPISRDWLRSIGSVRVRDDIYPNSEGNDNEQLGRLVLWEFNDTGRWHVRDADWMCVSTRGQLCKLLEALKGGS